MKRSRQLASLSRDHHQALVIALRLRRAEDHTAEQAQADFLDFWRSHGREHFRAEEEILLPAFAGHGDPHHPLVLRALGDHVAIRHRADSLATAPVPPVLLHELGERLAAHVRFEEWELFPLVEQTLPPDALAAVATAFEAV